MIQLNKCIFFTNFISSVWITTFEAQFKILVYDLSRLKLPRPQDLKKCLQHLGYFSLCHENHENHENNSCLLRNYTTSLNCLSSREVCTNTIPWNTHFNNSQMEIGAYLYSPLSQNHCGRPQSCTMLNAGLCLLHNIHWLFNPLNVLILKTSSVCVLDSRYASKIICPPSGWQHIKIHLRQMWHG